MSGLFDLTTTQSLHWVVTHDPGAGYGAATGQWEWPTLQLEDLAEAMAHLSGMQLTPAVLTDHRYRNQTLSKNSALMGV